MKKFKIFRSMKLIILSLSILITYKSNGQTPAKVIPNFTFYKFDNKAFTNKDLVIGKEKFFIFFDVTCIHCQHTIQTLNARISECKGVSIYLISLNNKVQIENFLHKYGENIINQENVTILLDLGNQFIQRFTPRKYPSVFLYSKAGKLIHYSDEDETLNSFFRIINASKSNA